MMSVRPIGKLVVHRRSHGVAMGTLDGFLVMRVFGETSPEDIYASLECQQIIMTTRPSGLVSIVAVDPTTTLPSEATRRASIDAADKTRHQTLGQVIIFLGDGFWASAFRGVLTTMNSASQTSYPKTVVRYEEEGVDWAIETLGESKPRYRSALLAALEELKRGSVASTPFTTLRP